MGTIMDALKKRYSGITNIDEAENIAEILSGVKGAGEPIEAYIDGFNIFTVLYTDGTLIINELIKDREANIAEHGEVVKEYDPWCTRQPYKFEKGAQRPWHEDRASILSVKFGSTVKPLTMKNWFNGCNLCTSIDTTKLDTSQCTSMNRMFMNCSALTSLDVSGFDTSKVTDMSSMFYNCAALTSIDVSGFDTSKVTSMSGMFRGCKVLTDIDVSGFDTSNVTSMAAMLMTCKALTGIDVSGFDTSNVANMSGMFNGCNALTDLDVSGFDTSKVTAINGMFSGCIALTDLDVSGFDTSNARDMTGMFYNCKALTSLDLSSFDTSDVNTMKEMFSGSTNLETITASDAFVTTGLDPDPSIGSNVNVFLNCTSLVGGNGTTYDANHVDSEYARIDTEETPGYFTAASAVETTNTEDAA